MVPQVRQCVCCNKSIKKLDGFPTDKPWDGMWHDGIVERISAGYGSTLDGDMYVLAICDDCVKEKRETGVLEFVGDYMCPSRKSYKDDWNEIYNAQQNDTGPIQPEV